MGGHSYGWMRKGSLIAGKLVLTELFWKERCLKIKKWSVGFGWGDINRSGIVGNGGTFIWMDEEGIWLSYYQKIGFNWTAAIWPCCNRRKYCQKFLIIRGCLGTCNALNKNNGIFWELFPNVGHPLPPFKNLRSKENIGGDFLKILICFWVIF